MREQQTTRHCENTDLCRVRLYTNGLLLQFRATVEQGTNFADSLRQWPSGLRAQIDDEVSPALPWLPCRTLFD